MLQMSAYCAWLVAQNLCYQTSAVACIDRHYFISASSFLLLCLSPNVCSAEVSQFVAQAVEEEDEEGKTDEFGGGVLRKRQRAARHEQQSNGDTADLQQVDLQSLSHIVWHAMSRTCCAQTNLLKPSVCDFSLPHLGGPCPHVRFPQTGSFYDCLQPAEWLVHQPLCCVQHARLPVPSRARVL